MGYTQWADINGDGKADLLCDDTAGRHWVKLSAGNGKFTNGRHYMSSWCGHSGSRTNWADVNGDGKADILCDDTAGRHWWRASAGGEGHFHGSHHYLNGWCSHSGSKTNWADINGDGKADLLCDDSAGRHWYKLGAFGASRHYLSGWCGHSGSYTQWADINGDGIRSALRRHRRASLVQACHRQRQLRRFCSLEVRLVQPLWLAHQLGRHHRQLAGFQQK